MAKIPTILEAGRADGKLATSGTIFDENKGMFQSEINDIQDTLNSDNPNKPLSAKQGKILKDLLDSKVIETGAIPIDTEPTEGNTTHIVNSDGIKKELNKLDNKIKVSIQESDNGVYLTNPDDSKIYYPKTVSDLVYNNGDGSKISEGLGNNGLNFSHYSLSKDPTLYNKTILFAGIVPEDDYKDTEFVINALTGNRYDGTNFSLFVKDGQSGVVNDNHYFQLSQDITNVDEKPIRHFKISNIYGTLYVIANVKYIIGTEVIWTNDSFKEVEIMKITSDDPRIEHWGKTYVDNAKVNTIETNLNNTISRVNTLSGRIAEFEDCLDFSHCTFSDDKKYQYTKAILFATVVPKSGYENAKFNIGVLSTIFGSYKFCFRVADCSKWSTEKKIYNVIDYSTKTEPTNKYVFVNVSNTYGTLYAVIDYAYVKSLGNGGIIQDWSGDDNKVEVFKTTDNDPRIKMFKEFATNEYVDTAIDNALSGEYNIDFSSTSYSISKIKQWKETLPYISIVPKTDLYKTYTYKISAFSNQSSVHNAEMYRLWVRVLDENGTQVGNDYRVVETKVELLDDVFYFKYSDTNFDVYINGDKTKNIGTYWHWGESANLMPIFSKFGNPNDPYLKGWNIDTSNLVEEAPKNSNSYVRKNGQWVVNSIDTNNSFWKDKNIVWFGTSIPEGADVNLGQEGIGITYPVIAASYVGATGYNEALGSSFASCYKGVSGKAYTSYSLCMGLTIAEKLEVFKTLYDINDNTKTVSMGSNQWEITGLPYTTTPTYDNAVKERNKFIKNSFEVKLIAKYLDKTNNYLRTVFNSAEVKASITYSGDVYTLLYSSDYAFRCQPDLFVFDHGTNDSEILVKDTDADISSRDTTKWYGAMNTYIDWIHFYCPQKMIAQVSVYGTGRSTREPTVYEHQKKWAEYNQLPFFDLTKVLPYGGRTITVQGYWDGNNTQGGVWHDTGFTFTANADDTFTTNNDMFVYKWEGGAPTPASELIRTYNIRTLHGVQVYDIPQRRAFFKDALHPHTNSTGDALKQTAKVLSKMIDQIAPIN